MDRSGQIYAIIIFGLCLILAIYVVYRLITDRKKLRKAIQHPNYPLTSNPSDGIFPDKNDKLGWASYISLSIALVLFLVNLFFLDFGNEEDNFVLISNFFGVFLMIGLALQGIRRLRNTDSKR